MSAAAEPAGTTAPAMSTEPATSTELVTNLLLGAHATTAAVAALGARLDLSVDEWLILDALHRADGVSMSEVSARTLASGASLTRAVDRLVSRSLVYRSPSATDRRKVVVRISDLGRDLHARMAAEVAGLETALRSGLPSDGVDDLLAALRRIVAQTAN
ncbi:MAG: MarR family transcriptional regulator [Gordonia sp. (in: high G+C Gram-positive bacteria)]|uniref:MarR family winged helix-turn-helix transcriptional regulator n=1 Tax=Gordonia TaxID=2053 RepID=UPI003265AC4E